MEAYFPQCANEDELRVMADKLMKLDEVDYASLDTWFDNNALDGSS